MPQRDPHSSIDPLDPIYKKMQALENRIASLENLSIPTVPFYDPDNYPQDSVEGQVAIGTDDVHRWYSHGAWHRAAVAMPWIRCSASNWADGQTVPHNSDYFLNLHGFTYAPNSGSIDDAVYGGLNTSDVLVDLSNSESFKGIVIRSPGLYYTRAYVAWYGDWGDARINYAVGPPLLSSTYSTDMWDQFISRTDSEAPQFVGGSAQYFIKFDTLFTVDPADSHTHLLRYFVNQSDSVNHTFDGGHGAISSIQIIRLSPFFQSNPG